MISEYPNSVNLRNKEFYLTERVGEYRNNNFAAQGTSGVIISMYPVEGIVTVVLATEKGKKWLDLKTNILSEIKPSPVLNFIQTNNK